MLCRQYSITRTPLTSHSLPWAELFSLFGAKIRAMPTNTPSAHYTSHASPPSHRTLNVPERFDKNKLLT
jgi:hypothetical protein